MKDYTKTAKTVASDMLEILEAMQKSQSVSDHEKRKYAKIVNDYIQFIEEDFVNDKKLPEENKKEVGITDMERGGKNKAIPVI